MKKLLVFVLFGSFFMLGLSLGYKKSASMIPEKQMVQVGIIVTDIQKSAENWASFLGEDVPDVSLAAGSIKNPTRYNEDLTDAKAKLAFFQLDNITIELIEPIGGPSTWQEFLDNQGEGIHHIAFNVKGMENTIKEFEQNGIPMIQHGGWETGEYSYMDGSEKLALIIELLEHYNK